MMLRCSMLALGAIPALNGVDSCVRAGRGGSCQVTHPLVAADGAGHAIDKSPQHSGRLRPLWMEGDYPRKESPFVAPRLVIVEVGTAGPEIDPVERRGPRHHPSIEAGTVGRHHLYLHGRVSSLLSQKLDARVVDVPRQHTVCQLACDGCAALGQNEQKAAVAVPVPQPRAIKQHEMRDFGDGLGENRQGVELLGDDRKGENPTIKRLDVRAGLEEPPQ
mmetsp:Transcript_14225/g.40900  ORF Transcript_14225/g.40900 Transcript_14225/m.40900 type:complete len:219 (-) Transcript_14225:525-1181(-)